MLGGDGFGRTDQIAFILALGRVQHDDEFAVPCPDESAVPISPFAHSAPKLEFFGQEKNSKKRTKCFDGVFDGVETKIGASVDMHPASAGFLAPLQPGNLKAFVHGFDWIRL